MCSWYRGGSENVEGLKSDWFSNWIRESPDIWKFWEATCISGVIWCRQKRVLFQGIHSSVQESLQEIRRLLRQLKEIQSRFPKGFPGVNVVAKCNRAVFSSIGEDVSFVTPRMAVDRAFCPNTWTGATSWCAFSQNGFIRIKVSLLALRLQLLRSKQWQSWGFAIGYKDGLPRTVLWWCTTWRGESKVDAFVKSISEASVDRSWYKSFYF